MSARAKTKPTPTAAEKLFATRLTRAKFSSPASLSVFPRPIQEQLRDSIASRANVKGSKKGQLDQYQYWTSFPQALRVFNTMPKFGEKPAQVTNGATRVVPLSTLKDVEEQTILQTYPPYFTAGVGIFFDWKWHKLQAPKLLRFLNPKRNQRELFIDVDSCEDNGFDIAKSVSPIEMHGVCDRVLYCADQMEHPHRVFPIRGLALNPTTARRYTMPAHDVLVTAALLRGYVSPFWLTENQITRFYRVGLKKTCINDFVEVPGRAAILVKFSALPRDMQQEITNLYPTPPEEEREGITVALDGGNWEVVVHQSVLQEMAKKCNVPEEMSLWVSLSAMRTIFKEWNKGTSTWSFLNCSSNDKSGELRHFLESKLGSRDNWLDQADVTKMKLYNAEATTNPRMILPQTRNLALCNGKQMNSKSIALVMKHSFQKGYLSPLWLSPVDVLRIPGLAIKPDEKPLEISEKSQPRELLFNIDDLEEESLTPFLNKKPPPTDSVEEGKHYTFTLNWQHIVSIARQKLLTSQNRSRNLWINHAEVNVNGLVLKDDVKPIQMMVGCSGRTSDRSAARGGGDNVRRLYNAEQTTDPVRVSALALMKAQ